ncbi:hypothetical protein G7054_g6401 [Neopestalotiopsis clavispora]|nr:hypothetical protein G7054_g6401 [Neopestalotiopsis clavispora]
MGIVTLGSHEFSLNGVSQQSPALRPMVCTVYYPVEPFLFRTHRSISVECSDVVDGWLATKPVKRKRAAREPGAQPSSRQHENQAQVAPEWVAGASTIVAIIKSI